jgi:hypothetical protein
MMMKMTTRVNENQFQDMSRTVNIDAFSSTFRQDEGSSKVGNRRMSKNRVESALILQSDHEVFQARRWLE